MGDFEGRAASGEGSTSKSLVPRGKGPVPDASSRESPPALVEELGFLSPAKRAVYLVGGLPCLYWAWAVGALMGTPGAPPGYLVQLALGTGLLTALGLYCLVAAWRGVVGIRVPGSGSRLALVVGLLGLAAWAAAVGAWQGTLVALLCLILGIENQENLRLGRRGVWEGGALLPSETSGASGEVPGTTDPEV